MRGFANREEVERLRRKYPAGCRIVLDKMDDKQAPKIGTQGVCHGVDDAGNIMASWDTGGHLSVAFGADRCHKVTSEEEIKTSLEWYAKKRQGAEFCPRCGCLATKENRLLALSRRADITVCETCGTVEALEDAGLTERLPLSGWSIVKEGWT